MTLWVGLPDLANKNAGHPVNFKSLIKVASVVLVEVCPKIL